MSNLSIQTEIPTQKFILDPRIETVRFAPPLFVGVVGAAESGKDTAADVIVQYLSGVKPTLSEPLKKIGMEFFGMSDEDCYTHDGKARMHPYVTFPSGQTMTNRNVLEQIGDKIQELDPLVLIRYVQTNTNPDGVDFVVLPDLRTEPQAEFIRSQGGIILYVKRPVSEKRAEAVTGEDAHHTKTFYKRTRADITIHNEGTLGQFAATVYHVFRWVLPDKMRAANAGRRAA